MQNFYRRILPDTCTSFSSAEGKVLFEESLAAGHMNCYFRLAAQFRTQDEPAFCGISTLVMVLNSLEVDPKRVWKGPWRWYHEEMLDCCVPLDVVRQNGITLDQFTCLAACNTLDAQMVRADGRITETSFRKVISDISRQDSRILVASYSRRILGQTGDGHFSPIAGYHPDKDMVLILDTARFKYPPHWVPLSLLYKAMQAHDKDAGQPRGYVVLSKTDTRPLVLFRTSHLFSVTSKVKSSVTDSVIKFLQWTQCPCPEREDNVVVDILNKWYELLQTLNEDEFILQTQVEMSQVSRMSEEYSCMIREIVCSLESTALYREIQDVMDGRGTDADFRAALAKVGRVTESVKGCCQEQRLCEEVLGSLSVGHFMTVFLLSLPLNDKLPVQMPGQYSMAPTFQQLVQANLDSCNDTTKNEVLMLRSQINTVIGYSKQCACKAM